MRLCMCLCVYVSNMVLAIWCGWWILLYCGGKTLLLRGGALFYIYTVLRVYTTNADTGCRVQLEDAMRSNQHATNNAIVSRIYIKLCVFSEALALASAY